MNKIEIKIILDKTKVLHTEILKRFLVENNLTEDSLQE
jgi:hypothetical protein